jgi:hypothetical protein
VESFWILCVISFTFLSEVALTLKFWPWQTVWIIISSSTASFGALHGHDCFQWYYRFKHSLSWAFIKNVIPTGVETLNVVCVSGFHLSMNLLLLKVKHLNVSVCAMFRFGGGYSTVHTQVLFPTSAQSCFSHYCGYVL